MKGKGNSGISKRLEIEILLSMGLHRQVSLHVWVGGGGGGRAGWCEKACRKSLQSSKGSIVGWETSQQESLQFLAKNPLYWVNKNIYCGWDNLCCGQENNNLSILMNNSLKSNQSKKNAGLKPQFLQLAGVIYKTLISGWLFELRIACIVPP